MLVAHWLQPGAAALLTRVIFVAAYVASYSASTPSFPSHVPQSLQYDNSPSFPTENRLPAHIGPTCSECSPVPEDTAPDNIVAPDACPDCTARENDEELQPPPSILHPCRGRTKSLHLPHRKTICIPDAAVPFCPHFFISLFFIQNVIDRAIRLANSPLDRTARDLLKKQNSLNKHFQHFKKPHQRLSNILLLTSVIPW